jgi:hypothetical protein
MGAFGKRFQSECPATLLLEARSIRINADADSEQRKSVAGDEKYRALDLIRLYERGTALYGVSGLRWIRA